MGNTIAKTAARERIMEDVGTTITKAAAHTGDEWAEAGKRLGPSLQVYQTIETKLADATKVADPLIAARAQRNESADDLVKRVADDAWNEVGRPLNDPIYEVLFPGGATIYTEGRVQDQPDMMDLLAELLEAKIHPRISAESAATLAARVRGSSSELRAAVDAASGPEAKVDLYDRALTAVARSAQVELAKLKKFWRSVGFSESDIHQIIPDRPRNYGVPEKPVTTP